MDIHHVLAELKTERQQLDNAIRALENLDGTGRRVRTHTTDGSSAIVSRQRGRRTMSAAGRRRIAEAQRARWAKVKAKNAGPNTKKAATRHVSAAARRKMAAAQKARWAKIRAAKKTATTLKKAA